MFHITFANSVAGCLIMGFEVSDSLFPYLFVFSRFRLFLVLGSQFDVARDVLNKRPYRRLSIRFSGEYLHNRESKFSFCRYCHHAPPLILIKRVRREECQHKLRCR